MIGKIFGVVLIVALLVSGAFTAWYAIESRGVAAELIEEKYLTPADRFVDIGGARVRVRTEGPAGAPAIIMNHGFAHSLETWNGWADALKNDYRVIRYDLAGHGLTGPDPEMRYAPVERAGFLGDLMDALDIDRAIVAGNSLGGLVAWRFASANPDRVDALLLTAPGVFSINGVADEPVRAPLALQLFLMTAPETGMRKAAERVYGDDAKVTNATVERMRDMIRRRGNGAALIAALNEFTIPDPTEELQALVTPTLILWGSEDAIIPVEQGERMAALMPIAELIILPGVGHVAQEEAPEETSRKVRMFLKSFLDSPASSGEQHAELFDAGLSRLGSVHSRRCLHVQFHRPTDRWHSRCADQGGSIADRHATEPDGRACFRSVLHLSRHPDRNACRPVKPHLDHDRRARRLERRDGRLWSCAEFHATLFRAAWGWRWRGGGASRPPIR